MADKIIKQIALTDGNYDLDAKYWNGHEWSELAHAIKFIGKGVTTKPAAGNYKCAIVTVDDASVTYYISITETGTATEIAAEQGDVFVVIDTSKEYICIKGGLSTANEWAELGDEGLYAKKSIAGKAGTYTSSAVSTSSSGSAGAETAVGTATVSYMKSDAATGSTHGEASANTDAGGAVSIAYTPSGSISGSQTISAHSHGVNLAKATVTYVDDVNANTGSVEGHTHSVTGKVTAAGAISVGTGTTNYTPAGSVGVSINDHTFTPSGTISGTAVGNHTYKPEGTISAVSASNHSHTIDSHAHTANVTAVSGYPNFSGGSASGSFNTDAIKDIELAASTVSTEGPVYVEDVTHTAASLTGDKTFVTSISGFSGGSLGGTKVFNTDAIKDVTLAASTVSTSGPAYVEDVTHTAASLTGDTSFVKSITNWSGGSLNGATAKTVVTGVTAAALTGDTSFFKSATVNSGVLSFVSGTVGISGGVASGTTSVVPSYTLTGATCTIAMGSIGINGGAISKTIKYMSHSNTAASTASVTYTAAVLGTQNKGTVGISGGSITPVKKYMAHSNTAASKGNVSWTAASLGAASTVSAAGASSAATLTTSGAGSFSVTPVFTGTTATLSHSVTQPTFAGASVTLAHTASGSFTGTGVNLKFTGSQVDLNSGLAASAGGHSHTVGHSTATFNNVTGVTLNTAGSATIDFSKASFSGASVTLSQASHTHGYKKPADHTHTIGLTSTSVTGSAAVAVSNHTHSIGHTHTVVIPNCEN